MPTTLLALVCGCSNGNGVAPPDNPGPDAAALCEDACGENTPDASVPPPVLSDPVEFVSVGDDNFGGFFEPVEVQIWGDQVALCTGVQGLAVYRAADPCCLSLEASVRFSAGSARYPRCQHLDREGDRVVLAHRGDEIQPEAFLTVLDISSLDDARTLSTLSDGTSFEGVTIQGNLVYAAMHESGLGVFRLEGDGSLTELDRVTEGTTNAWKPLVDPGGAFIYLADAGGGLKVFSLADSEHPRFLAAVPTEGTLKELVQVGDVLYGASGSAGVEIFDVSDPALPVALMRANTPGSALGVDANEDFLVVADWNAVQVYDLSDPRSPRHLGHQKAYFRGGPSATGRILDVALRGQDVFMAEWAKFQAHRIVKGAESPDLWTADFVELPRTEVGQQSSTAIAIQNLGTQDLVISSVSVPAPFSVSPSSLTIAAGRRDLVTLDFSPDSDGAQRTELTLVSNDPDQGELDLSVRANLSGLQIGDAVPNLVFDTLDGGPITLEGQRGGPVLLAYFATF